MAGNSLAAKHVPANTGTATPRGMNVTSPSVAPIQAPVPVTGLQILPPIAALIELAVMVVGLLLLEWSFPALDIVNLQPSPYWIPVLLLSLQYGTPSGSLAAIFVIAIYFTIGSFPEQGVGENEFTYRLRILVQPILWIAAAVLLGQFRMVQITTKQELTQRLATLENEAQVLADYSTRLRSRCDVLERSIAGQSVTQGAPLLEALAGLQLAGAGADGPTSRLALERCLEAAFPGASASVFWRHADQLELAASTGWAEGAPWKAIVAKGHPLYNASVEAQRALTVLEAGHEPYLDHQGVAAVPIFEARLGKVAGGTVVGILKIEQIDAKSLTPKLPMAMAALASHIAACRSHNRSLVDRFEPGAQAVVGTHADAAHAREAERHDERTASVIDIDLIRPKVMR